ncbi:hypothetical protein [Amnibacterium kyonggiense]
MPGGPPRRIDPGGVHRFEVDPLGVVDDDLRLRERREVVLREHRRDLVALDGQHPQPDRRDGQRVAAEPAAEVGDGPRTGRAEAGRVPRGHAEPGRLLEAGPREQHAVRELAELRPGATAQGRLRQDGRRLLRGEARAPQRRRPGERVARQLGSRLVVDGREHAGVEERLELAPFHPTTVGVAGLALALHECQGDA